MTYLNFNKFMKDIVSSKPNDKFIAFNTSIAKIDNNNYIYAVRYSWSPDILKLVPGNDEKCEKTFEIGINYWWNHWNSVIRKFDNFTLFFIGNYEKNNIKPLKIISSVKYKHNILKEIGKNEFSNSIQDNDLRIINMNNQIYLHDSDLKNIYICKLIDENNYLEISNEFSADYVRGKNFGILNMYEKKILNDTELFFRFTDWFYESGKKGAGVYLYDVPLDKELIFSGATVNQIVIKYENEYILSGKGSTFTENLEDIKLYGKNYGIMPLFSFGTPHVKYTSKKFGECFLGVGHIKIHSDDDKYIYKQNSNIQNFRNNLYQDLKNQFGDKYIRHMGTGKAPDCYGYIYMMYFYLINNDLNKMILSDSFLPVDLDEKLEYRFSLIFPMGLTKKDEQNVLISGGEGDYYSIQMEFNIEEIENLCIHNVQKTDLNNYGYKFIVKKNKQVIVDDSFEKIIAKIKQTGGNKMKKYKLILI